MVFTQSKQSERIEGSVPIKFMVVILVVFTRELSVADHLIVDYCCQRNQALELLFDPTSLGSNHPQAL